MELTMLSPRSSAMPPLVKSMVAILSERCELSSVPLSLSSLNTSLERMHVCTGVPLHVALCTPAVSLVFCLGTSAINCMAKMSDRSVSRSRYASTGVRGSHS